MTAVSMWYPGQGMPSNTFDVTIAINATGDKLSYCGQFYHPDAASGKSISRVQFRFGNSVTKAGGSGLTVSLQDVLLTATAAPIVPDETQDQTVAIANGDTSFAANAWCRTGEFSSARSISNGDWLAVVWEFDSSGRLGSDQFSLQSQRSNQHAGNISNNSNVVRKAGGTWAATSVYPNIAIECTDGTFGCLNGFVWPCSYFVQNNITSASTPDEYATSFTPELSITVDMIVVMTTPFNYSADYELVIYTGTTAIYTQVMDASAQRVTGIQPVTIPLTSRVTLSAGTEYTIAIRPTTTNSGNAIWVLNFESAAIKKLTGWPDGSGLRTRTDQGSWSAVNTSQTLAMQLHVVDIAGGGASRPMNPFNQQVIR
jgi:hypothetical protein